MKVRLASAQAAALSNGIDPEAHTPAPCVKKVVADKVKTYAPLLHVTQQQKAKHARALAPEFVPFVVSNYGEMNEGADKLMQWITAKYRRKVLSEGRTRADGVKPEELVIRFRSEFRDRLVACVARGFGSMIVHAGIVPSWND